MTGDFCVNNAECARRTQQAIPTVSSRGLVVAASALMLFGALAVMRRRRA
jgi:hypothetical protein